MSDGYAGSSSAEADTGQPNQPATSFFFLLFIKRIHCFVVANERGSRMQRQGFNAYQ